MRTGRFFTVTEHLMIFCLQQLKVLVSRQTVRPHQFPRHTRSSIKRDSTDHRLALLVRFSPVSNIILRLVRGTLGFSMSAAPPSVPLLGLASMSERSSGSTWLVSGSWSSESVVVTRALDRFLGDVRAGLVLVWLRGLAGLQDVDWVLQLDGCCCSQCFFKTLRFPPCNVEGRGCATCSGNIKTKPTHSLLFRQK